MKKTSKKTPTKATKPENKKSVLKSKVSTNTKVAKSVATDKKVVKSPVEKLSLKSKVLMPKVSIKEKATSKKLKSNKEIATSDLQAQPKTEMVKAAGKAVARVIEPLSWDAEKPKLNFNMQFKTTRISKEKEELEVKSYSIKARYTVGDRVMHQDFGKGLVRDLIGDFKIRVAFRDFEKVLVHGINQ